MQVHQITMNPDRAIHLVENPEARIGFQAFFRGFIHQINACQSAGGRVHVKKGGDSQGAHDFVGDEATFPGRGSPAVIGEAKSQQQICFWMAALQIVECGAGERGGGGAWAELKRRGELERGRIEMDSGELCQLVGQLQLGLLGRLLDERVIYGCNVRRGSRGGRG